MEINLKTLLDWILKGIVFIVVVTLLAGAGAFLYTKYFVAPTYRAEVKFCADSEDRGNAGMTYYKSVAPQYVELLNVNEFYQMVADELLNTRQKFYETSQIRRMVNFSGVVEDTSVFYARVTAPDAQEAYDVAYAVAAAAPKRIQSLRGEDSLMVASMPQKPSSPASPSVRNNTIYGLFAGLVISVVLVVVKELLDNRIKTADEITEMYGLPVLGAVPDFSNQEKEGQ